MVTKQFSRSWWGKRFIETLEEFTDSGRLSRGRSYASGGKVTHFRINGGTVAAQVRGSVNPYYGIYKEPLYTTEIDIQPIRKTQWTAAIAHLSSQAGFISKLLLNEIPDNIEDAFKTLNLHLLPTETDLTTRCSCPDASNPCKHIAGVYYLVAAELDRDPFLLFELRGLPRAELQAELAKSSLGQALSSELNQSPPQPQPVDAYYTRPEVHPWPEAIALKDFWQGAKRLPPLPNTTPQPGVSAILIKKQGDFPPFWTKDSSFIEVMEDFYKQVKAKNRDIL